MSLKWIKSRKRFEKQNLTFDPETFEGRSYKWYLISAKIGGKIVVNKYPYSRTTMRHYGEIMGMLRSLGVAEIYSISAPSGLRNQTQTINYYKNEISKYEDQIAKPRSRASTNAARREHINRLKKELDLYLNLTSSEEFDQHMTNLLSGA
jgi:hypothetical protein